jgi:hypothetical protein
MSPGKYGVVADAELHLAFNALLVLQHFFPIDFELLAEHDRSDKCICVVRRLDAAGPQVSFGFKLLAAFAVVELPKCCARTR